MGCIMGCTFCATGTMGIKGDLTAGEIVEQLVHARAVSPIRNIGELPSWRLADLGLSAWHVGSSERCPIAASVRLWAASSYLEHLAELLVQGLPLV